LAICDRLVNHTLRRAGWRVIRIWECDLARLKAKGQMLKFESNKVVQRIQQAVA